MLGIELRALCVLGYCSATKLHFQIMILWDKILLHRSSWLWICFVAQAYFELMSSYLCLKNAGVVAWDSGHASHWVPWMILMDDFHLENFNVSPAHNKGFWQYYFAFLQAFLQNLSLLKEMWKKIKQNCKSQWHSRRPRVFKIPAGDFEKWKTFRALGMHRL